MNSTPACIHTGLNKACRSLGRRDRRCCKRNRRRLNPKHRPPKPHRNRPRRTQERALGVCEAAFRAYDDKNILALAAACERFEDGHGLGNGVADEDECAGGPREKIAERGGILATFSCSGSVGMEHFRQQIAFAAKDAKRETRVLHHLHQADDHPVRVSVPETEYLKGLVCVVE